MVKGFLVFFAVFSRTGLGLIKVFGSGYNLLLPGCRGSNRRESKCCLLAYYQQVLVL